MITTKYSDHFCGVPCAFKFSVFAAFLTLPFTTPILADYVSPNTFGFTSDVYYVDEDDTNATITVEFIPGDRSHSGSVAYSTTGGTAEAGEDYQPVSGTLVFSGPGTPIPTITVPFRKENLSGESKTVELSLHCTNSVLTRSNCTLVLLKKSLTPSLRLAPGEQPGYLLLSWVSYHSDFVLEKSSNPSGDHWEQVPTPPNVRDGFFWVSDAQTETPAFYRLRKNAAP